MSKINRATRNMQNAYPSWSKIRKDKQSVGAQLLNEIGEKFDLLEEEASRTGKNKFATSFMETELDKVYVIDLPEDFEFTEDSFGNKQPPTLRYPLAGPFTYPYEEVKTEEFENFSTRAIVQMSHPAFNGVLIAGKVSTEEIATIDYKLHSVSGSNTSEEVDYLIQSNYLWIKSENCTQYYVEGSSPIIGKVRITGESLGGIKRTEEFFFLYDEMAKSKFIWEKVSKIELIDFPESVDITIFQHDGWAMSDTQEPEFIPIPFSEDEADEVSDELLPKFIKPTSTGVDVYSYSDKRIKSVVGGDSVLVKEHEVAMTLPPSIQGVSGKISSGLQFFPGTNYLYVLDEKAVHVYDFKLDNFDMSLLQERTQGAECQIEADRDIVGREEEVDIDFTQLRKSRTIKQYRIRILYPDGQFYTLDKNNNLVVGVDNWLEDPLDRRVHPGMVWSSILGGDHAFYLDVEYVDGTIETDAKIIKILYLEPVHTFYVDFEGVNTFGLHFNPEHGLVIGEGDENSITLKKCQMLWFKMLVDYDRKTITIRDNLTDLELTY